MSIDQETEPNFINIVIDNKEKYLNELKKQAEAEEQEYDCLSITKDKHFFQTDEYYYDNDRNTILISGKLISNKGNTFIYIEMPLSDNVLCDILSGGLKKFNKLKTALEVLK